jgi:L-ascorbate metabolism protein UlaG (beta-lactamase superfamily)
MYLSELLFFKILPALGLCAGLLALQAAQRPDSLSVRVQADGGRLLSLADTVAGRKYRISFAEDLQSWTPLFTVEGSGASAVTYRDGVGFGGAQRFYRSEELAVGSVALSGDHFMTGAGLVTIHPVNHASFVMQVGDTVVYNDPVGGAGAFAGFPKADLVLIGHRHGDHFSSSTLGGVIDSETVIVAPQDVYGQFTTALKAQTTVLANGGNLTVLGIGIDAIPAYNTNHPVGRDNGYVLTVGGTRIYMSGDTGSTTEMRALDNIDVAFLAMNVPFTMTVDDAATATRAFKPKVVYPYHYRNQDSSFADLVRFEALVNEGTEPSARIDVRDRSWY